MVHLKPKVLKMIEGFYREIEHAPVQGHMPL